MNGCGAKTLGGNVPTGMVQPKKDIKQVEGEMNDLLSCLSSLEMEVNELGVRLQPLIYQTSQCPEAAKDPQRSLAPLPEVIRIQANRVRVIIQTIKYYQETIQL